jgi:nicotinamidase-related amidase
MDTSFKKSELILQRNNTALVIIDIQEKILAAMLNSRELINNTLKLIKGFKVLNLPIIFTEQYPKGLGPTSAELLEELQDLTPIQKTTFSCFGNDSFAEQLFGKNIKQVVIAGIESHVCVQQTVMDLLANDFQVDIAADAVSSRYEMDYNTALSRMRSLGAEITTVESILFELTAVSGTDEFKKISKIIK